MSKVVSSVTGALTGGLIGGPKVEKPTIITPKSQRSDVDPNRGAQIAAAKKRRAAAAGKAGRSSLRVDLENQGTQTRGGISIS